jgi:anti-sigma B factor antagonist
MHALTVTMQRREDLSVLVPVGEIDVDMRPILDEAVSRLPDPVGAVRVDMAGVSFMDSGGIHFLVDLRRQVDQAGGNFTISGLHGQPDRVVRLVGLQDYLGRR